MPKAKPRAVKAEPQWYRAEIAAARVHISHSGHDVQAAANIPTADTSMEFDGTLTHPITLRIACLVVCRDEQTGVVGTIIGIKPAWQLVASLPRIQFADLILLAATQRVRRIQFSAPKPRYGKATINSISFSTELDDEQ